MKNKIMYSDVQCTKHINGVEDALYVLGGKWKLRIVITLNSGHKDVVFALGEWGHKHRKKITNNE